MPVKQRLVRVSLLGSWIMFTIVSDSISKMFRPDEISYEIVSRLICPEGIFMEIVNNQPVVRGNSLAEIQNFFRRYGINDLPGKKPCEPNCFRCNGKCLNKAA